MDQTEDDALRAALAQAEQFKNDGNAALKEKNYAEAIRLYTCALDLDPTNAIYLSNRSAAHLSNDSKTKALRDAEACIESKPNWWKGYMRKGAAEHALNRFDMAKQTYFRGLEKDPGNTSLQEAIEAVQVAHEAYSLQLKKENAEKEAIRQAHEAEAKAKADEEALLASFMDEVEALEDQANTVKKPEPVERIKPPVDFGTPEGQIIRLLQPHFEWINLNPFRVLMLDTDATDEEIKQHYRKLSAMVHPDKNPDPRAREAFEAHDQMTNEDRRKTCMRMIENAIEAVAVERKQKLKKFRVDQLPDINDLNEKAVLKAFADSENRRRNVEARELKQRRREVEQEEAEKEKVTSAYLHDKEWSQAERRDKRMANWLGVQSDPNKKVKTLPKNVGWQREEKKEPKKHGVVDGNEYKKSWK
ncbi:hypothetical protein DYB32_000163 [Aphanomyces invadans]|uniref:Hsp70-Hsp90 organising protein n=1 Tax=Aphanomyces invadans TaxID=157072 RepID=A0A418BAW4_9STRA|nr:hypothetical protein DYB32_000163 [Aphanomyces invadans]